MDIIRLLAGIVLFVIGLLGLLYFKDGKNLKSRFGGAYKIFIISLFFIIWGLIYIIRELYKIF